ncbi:MAG: DUF6934 family protein [Dyadobacter fermentans]
MDQPHYAFTRSHHSKVYYFVSTGTNGNIKKRVQFDLIHENIFNIGFGDWAENGIGLDDMTVTNNGDMEMVLATVIKIIMHFLALNPFVSVYLTGSTTGRTRLYRAIIGKNFEVISKEFKVLGLLCGDWLNYEKNVNYEAFLVQNRFNFIK